MYQIYLLSVVFNLLAGITLAFETLDNKLKIGAFFSREAFMKPSFRLILGILTAAAAVLNLLSVAPTDVPIVGDLLPALVGLGSGFGLILQYYRSKATVETSEVSTLDEIFMKNGTVVGSVAIVTAILHFIFNQVLFL
jgi:hypothetical protein